MSADPTNLLELPHEILAATAGWLSVNDILYGLAPTCKALYAVANDPVTWARIAVDCVSEGELLRVLERYGQYITCVTCGVDENTLTLVATHCPNLTVFTDLYSESQLLQQEGLCTKLCVLTCTEFTGPLVSLAGRLRSLNVLKGLSPAQVDTNTLAVCTNLTHLACSNYLNVEPSSFLTRLSSLRTSCGGNVAGERWDAFATSHPSLTALGLDCRSGLNSHAGCYMPSTLKTLELFGEVGREWYEEFALALIRANSGLTYLFSAGVYSSALVDVLVQLPQLTRLNGIRFDNTVTSDTLRVFQMGKLEAIDRFDGRAPRPEFPVSAFGNVRVLCENLQKPALLLALGPRLCNLRELDLNRVKVTLELGKCIGTYCKRIRKCTLAYVAATNEAVDAMLPALSHLCDLTFTIVDALDSYGRLLACQEQLFSLDMVMRSAEDTNTLLAAALEAWDGHRISDLSIHLGDKRTNQMLVDAGNEGKLKLESLYFAINPEGMGGGDWETESLSALRRAVALSDPELIEYMVQVQ